MTPLYRVIFCGLIIFSVLSSALNLIQRNQLNQIIETETKEETAIKAEAKIIARKVDKNGLKHVTAEAVGIIIPRTKAKAAVSIGILDTTAMAIGILKKQVENLTVVNTTLKADKLKAIEERDESNRRFFSYRDKNINARYTPPADPSDSTDKGVFDFQYDNDLTITQYWKRQRVLGLPIGTKNSYIDIYSNDPRATIKGVKRLTVKQDQPYLGLRVQGVATYDFQRDVVLPGAGMQFDAGRLSVQGSYAYDFNRDYWVPSVSGRYDLVRF